MHVGKFFLFWNLVSPDEEHSLCSGWHVFTMTSLKVAKLAGARCLPEWGFTAILQFSVFGDLAGVGIESVAIEGKVIVSE